MITALHHFSIISSSELSISFYEKLGFRVSYKKERLKDTVVVMNGRGIHLEVFIDPSHPKRACDPENLGLRGLSFKVDDFEFAKLMVTKINPNAILAFKPMFLPLKGKKLNELDDETSEKRKFFVNYFENECDLSLDAFPNVKVKKICEMGFMTKKEIARIHEKRNKELNKYAAKSDYTRGSGYTFEL